MTPGHNELSKDQLLAEMSKYFVGYKEEIGLLLNAAMSNSLQGFPQHVMISGPPGIGRTALVSSLARCMQAPFFRIDTSRLCNRSFVADIYLSEVFSKLWISCGKDLNKLCRSIINVEFFGHMGSASNMAYQREMLSLIKDRVVYLRDETDTMAMQKTAFNTNHVMFVLSHCTIKNDGADGEDCGLLPALLEQVPTRLKLKPLTESQHFELISEMIAGRI